MLNFLRRLLPERHFLRLFYHKIKGIVAAIYYRFPANKMIVVGVTGTNGKTTTVNLITNILNQTEHKVGMASTINFQIAEKKWKNLSKQTTISPFKLQKMLRLMVDKGCKYAVLEVTSHALDQSRVWGVNFDVAVMSNITPDHIEYHGSFNEYIRVKGELFRKTAKAPRKTDFSKVLILNSDDTHFEYFNQFVADRKITYGLKKGTISALNIEKTPSGSFFELKVPNDSISLNLKLPGEYNVYNTLSAASACVVLGIPLDIIKKGIEETDSVSGRFESVDCGQNYNIIVDYAHAPEALESLLKLNKELTKGKLIVVFGATGGGRDKAKRPVMGGIADKYADFIILTNEDPYKEDPWQIIEHIAEGVNRKEGENFWRILDRKQAIRLALYLAKEGDTVVFAGKGAEEIMIVGDKKIPWDDRKVIREILSENK